jgi:thiamine kinase-like enzyme
MTDQDLSLAARERVKNLSIWRGPVEPERLTGGITNNTNFVVKDAGQRFVVRIGGDMPVHQIMRFNEHAASKAAFAAGISPEVVYSEPGILVIRYIEGRTCTGADLREPACLQKVLPLIKRVHRQLPNHIRGPMLAFWVFHVIRDYAHTLEEAGSRYASRMPELVDVAAGLELAIGPVDVGFGHNDLLATNFIDDGNRLWLIDWDYAGFNSPLFDLANLASNNEFAPEQEAWMLSTYFGRAPDDVLLRSYGAMKCASLLREAMWGMVSEIYSRLDYDYAAYTLDFTDRFARALADFNRKTG